MPTAGAKRYAVERLIGALALGLASQLLVSCLSLGDTEAPSTGGSGGAGGTDVGDAAWTGGSSSGGSSAGGSSTGGSSTGGSGGFVPGTCTACASADGCECVPEAPQGWSHIWVADGKLGSCPDAAAPVVVGTGAVDTGCDKCKCGAATPGSCGFGMVKHSYAGCASTGYYSLNTNVGTCYSLTGISASYMAKPFGTGGGCAPGTAPPKAPAFAVEKTLCSQPGAGACGTNGTCVAKPTSAFDTGACVMFDSQGVDVACPPGYPNKQPYSTSFDDTRTCSCKCKPSVYCSGGSVTFDCANGTANEALQCKDASAVSEYKILTLPTVQNTSCSADGTPTPSGGSVMASGLRVVCCH